MHSLEEQNILLRSQLEKKTLVVKRQQETIKDYESKFVQLSNQIDDLTKQLYENTTSTQKLKDDSETSKLSQAILEASKKSNSKSNMHFIPYEIPKKTNKTFKYVETVRCKHERAKLIGETCTCCEKFYKDDLQGKTSKERIQMNSRHRGKFKRPKTPPGFWDMDFPSDHE